MKYTNKNNLSPLMAGMIERSMERYDPGDSDYSTTTLIDSPRVVNLKRKHYNEIEVDVSDLIAAFVGNAMHEHLEGLAPDCSIVEYRLFSEVEGTKISGCIDIACDIETNTELELYQIGDYKTVKSWAIIHGSVFEKWKQQLNINAWLARFNTWPVNDIAFIEYFIMDWQQGIADNNKSYPQSQQGRWKCKLWPEEKQLEFIKERIALHEAAKEELPLCSDKDRWKKDDTYKLMKKGRKASIKNESTEEELLEYAKEKGYARLGKLGPQYSIEYFPGEYTRCKKYCPVNKWCEQYKG